MLGITYKSDNLAYNGKRKTKLMSRYIFKVIHSISELRFIIDIDLMHLSNIATKMASKIADTICKNAHL